MIDCPSCTNAHAISRLQASPDRRGQLQCPHCWRHFVFVSRELIELDEEASQGFELLDPAVSQFKRHNLLIWGGLLDPFAPSNKAEDPQRAAADRRELEQLRAPGTPVEGS